MKESSKHLELPRSVRLLMLSQSLSRLGDNFTEVALAVSVLLWSHHNPAVLGVVLAMTYAPRLSLGWIALGWIDRWHKRTLLLVGDWGRALLVLSIAVFHNLSWTMAAIFLMYTLSMVYQPTVRTIQPQLAGSVEANRVSVTRQNQWMQAASILAYLSSGLIILRFGSLAGFVVDSFTYLGASVLVLTIPATLGVWTPHPVAGASYLQQVGEGFRYIRHHRLPIGLILTSFGGMIAVAASQVLLAPAVHTMWHLPTAIYAWMLLAVAVGAGVGSRLLETHGQQFELRKILVAGFVLTAIAVAGLAALPGILWALLGTGIVMGIGNSAFATSIMVWLQQTLPMNIRGRVMTVRVITMGLGGLAGSLGAGFVARHTSISLGFIALAAILLLSSTVFVIPWFFAASSDQPVSPPI